MTKNTTGHHKKEQNKKNKNKQREDNNKNRRNKNTKHNKHANQKIRTDMSKINDKHSQNVKHSRI